MAGEKWRGRRFHVFQPACVSEQPCVVDVCISSACKSRPLAMWKAIPVVDWSKAAAASMRPCSHHYIQRLGKPGIGGNHLRVCQVCAVGEAYPPGRSHWSRQCPSCGLRAETAPAGNMLCEPLCITVVGAVGQ